MRLLSVGFGSFSTVSTRIVGWLMSASAHKRRSGPGQKRCVWPNPCDSNSPNWGLESCPYLYRARNQVERFFNRIKQCRRVATRYDRLAGNYLAFVQLASIRLWLAARYESTSWPVIDVIRDGREAADRGIQRS
jgi:Transposase DDE domain